MDEKSLSISVYDHFMYYINCRSTGIITDKQFVYYTQYNLEDDFAHMSSIMYLDKIIHYNRKHLDTYEQKSDVVVASTLNYFYIYLPENDMISKVQYKFLLYILEQLEKYNEDCSYRDGKIHIDIIANDKKDDIETYDFEAVKEVLARLRKRRHKNEEEHIIGKTIDDIDIKEKVR
jgi:hypothetical protein